jgi:hypothetical protein
MDFVVVRPSQLRQQSSASRYCHPTATEGRGFHAFDSWAVDEITKQLVTACDTELELKMSNLKPRIPAWIFAGFKRCAEDSEMVQAGWRKPGLLRAWNSAYQKVAPRLNNEGKLFESNQLDFMPDGDEEQPAENGVGDVTDETAEESCVQTEEIPWALQPSLRRCCIGYVDIVGALWPVFGVYDVTSVVVTVVKASWSF